MFLMHLEIKVTQNQPHAVFEKDNSWLLISLHQIEEVVVFIECS